MLRHHDRNLRGIFATIGLASFSPSAPPQSNQRHQFSNHHRRVEAFSATIIHQVTYMPAILVDDPATLTDQRTQFADARQILGDGVGDRAFPGAAYGVMSQGQLVALDSIGHFTYDQNSPSVIPATVYDIASLTKVVATTSVAMLLYDRGLLDLDQPLGDVLPGFVIGEEPGQRKDRVTFRMLLAHTSGLPAYERLFERHRTPNAMLRACLLTPLEAAPGAREEYSDLGFLLLGKALEVITGEWLCNFFEREIAAPLGLDSTRFCPPPYLRESIPPTENDTAFRHTVVQGIVHDENSYVLKGSTGHAGLFSNTLDLLRFSACILANGVSADGNTLFDPNTVALFATRQSAPAGTSRALGWDTPSQPSSSGSHFGPRSIGHLGFTGTSLWIDSDRSLSVVLLTNRTWPDRSNQAIRTIRPSFHDAIVTNL
jgi:CubicO group peptidase (beta-lactamase class C family)